MKKKLFIILIIIGVNTKTKAQTSNKLDIGLEEAIELTSKKFEKNNHSFLLNVVKDNNVIVQLVHQVLIPLSLGKQIKEIKKPDRKFNFCIYLTFAHQKDELNRFKKLSLFKKFRYHELDGGTPCYSFNLGTNKKETKRVTLEILKKVYNYKITDIFEFEIYDQGKF